MHAVHVSTNVQNEIRAVKLKLQLKTIEQYKENMSEKSTLGATKA